MAACVINNDSRYLDISWVDSTLETFADDKALIGDDGAIRNLALDVASYVVTNAIGEGGWDGQSLPPGLVSQGIAAVEQGSNWSVDSKALTEEIDTINKFGFVIR